MPALECQGLVRRLDGRLLLDEVSLTVPAGSVLGLVGANGAGKTSLFRAIAGRLRTDAGSISLAGVTLDLARRAGRLGVVPQDIALYPYLTVRENLTVLGRLAGVASRVLDARVDEALRWAGLEDRSRALVSTLSGGMRRRVNLVAGTLHHPTLLLLDEPTVGVDADSRARLHDLVLELRDRGVGIVIATHDIEEAARLCDHVAVMAAGRVVACGKVSELLDRSAHEAVLVLTTDPPQEALRVLEGDGFAPAGGRRWVRPAGGTLTDLAVTEQRLRGLGLAVAEARLTEPTLVGALAGLTRAAEGRGR